MQFRNSLLSVKRSPLKSILFLVLVFALTVIVMLGSTMVYTCVQTIRQCKQTYLTTAVLEYEGSAYPNQDVLDDAARSLASSIDFTALSQSPGVLQAQRSENVAVHISGLRNNTSEMPAANNVVLDVNVNSINDEGVILGSVNNALYSSTITRGRTVSLNSLDEWQSVAMPEVGKRYLLCGISDGASTGNSAIEIRSILPAIAADNGVELPSPIVELPGADYDRSDARYAVFFDIADVCAVINESRYAIVSSEPAILREFSQNEYLLKDGAFYTPQDCADGTICCLLPELVASRCGLAVGDTIDMEAFSVAERSLLDTYWPGSADARQLSCRISGIYGSGTDSIPRIYLSGCNGVKTSLVGYTLGTLLLENGTLAVPELPDIVTVTVYDQGYNNIHHALSELLSGALWLLVLSVLVATALLILFGFLFVSRQAEALKTMKMLGTRRWGLRRYVLYATGAVLLPAVAAACPTAKQFLGQLNELFARMTVADVSKTAFSTTGLSVVKPFSASVQMPWWLLICCAAAVLTVGLLFGLFFLFLSLREKKVKQKRKAAVPKERKSSLKKGAARKYIALSIRRGGLRSAVVPVLSLLLAVFLLTLGFTEQSYRNQRQLLDENTVITGYFTDFSGKYRTNLLLPERFLEPMQKSDLMENTLFSQAAYRFSGEVLAPDGEELKPMTVEVPQADYAYESFLNNLGMGPKLIFTPDLLATGGFTQDGKESITWLDGYNESYFTEEREDFSNLHEERYTSGWYSEVVTTFDEDLREFCCVAPEQFLTDSGARLGDSVTLLIKTEVDFSWQTYKVIGSYSSKNAAGILYTRLDNETQVMYYGYTRADSIPVVTFRDAYSGGTITLKDTSRLQEAKQAFTDMGYSVVRSSSRYRLYPIFDDSEYLNTAEKLESNISFMQLLRLAATVLTVCCGAAAAFLMSSRRKTELATLRSLGATKGKSFMIFFSEQLVLCLLGTVAAVLLWRLVEPWSLRSIYAASFAAGYLLATVFGLLRASRADLLTVLSEKE